MFLESLMLAGHEIACAVTVAAPCMPFHIFDILQHRPSGADHWEMLHTLWRSGHRPLHSIRLSWRKAARQPHRFGSRQCRWLHNPDNASDTTGGLYVHQPVGVHNGWHTYHTHAGNPSRFLRTPDALCCDACPRLSFPRILAVEQNH